MFENLAIVFLIVFLTMCLIFLLLPISWFPHYFPVHLLVFFLYHFSEPKLEIYVEPELETYVGFKLEKWSWGAENEPTDSSLSSSGNVENAENELRTAMVVCPFSGCICCGPLITLRHICHFAWFFRSWYMRWATTLTNRYQYTESWMPVRTSLDLMLIISNETWQREIDWMRR